MVVADSSVWIAYLRSPDSPPGTVLAELVNQGEVLMLGIVMAEVLQGVRVGEDRRVLERILTALPYEETRRRDWVRAAALGVELRTKGLAVPLSDRLIAAQALDGDHAVYTLDHHFELIPGMKLHRPT